MLVINYSDFTEPQDMSELCKNNKVIFDLKLYDIPKTMRRNIKTCADFGGYAVTIADDELNYNGIAEAMICGEEYGIGIILGSVDAIKEVRCGYRETE